MVSERSYNYPAKNAVRRCWMQFLPVDLSHSNDFGLYLPSHENLEQSGYLEKGLIGSRLIGAEHSQKKFLSVQRQAPGVWMVNGSIKEAVEFCKKSQFPRLRFANLDLDGNLHTFIEEILALARIFPSTRGSYLSITSYAARDQGALVQGIVNSCKFYSGLPSISSFVTQYGRMLGRYDHLLQLIPRHEATSHSHFQRELELLWWIVLMLSVIEPVVSEESSVFDHSYITHLDSLLVDLTNKVTADIDLLPDLDRLVFIANRELRSVLQNRRVHWWVQDLQRLAYWSSNRQPMRTWNFQIVAVDSDQVETAQSLLEQVWQLACHTPLLYVDPAGDRVTIG